MDSGEETADEGTKVIGTAEITLLDMVYDQRRRGRSEVSASGE